MIKFSGEAVSDKVKNGLGFSGENQEVKGSLSLNCDIATLPRKRPKNSRTLIKIT
jgi:hypothetical protein